MFGCNMKAILVQVLLLVTAIPYLADACRVHSEGLRSYTKKNVEHLLDAGVLETFFWPEEPLNVRTLAKALGLNLTLAETKFHLGPVISMSNLTATPPATTNDYTSFLKDMFVSCSTDRDRSYSLTINVEVDNPFKVIDFLYHGAHGEDVRFRIQLPESTFLVQLKQRIRYDECLDVVYVQLAPNIQYELDCIDCTPAQQEQLDRIFGKRMNQFDAELDPLLSDKMLLGLQILLNQQRLDLDLYLDNAQ